MDFIKQYLLQSITAASGNLRLNNQRLETIAMLKEAISKSKDIQQILTQMKKITELSKFAIKLNEIQNSLSEGSIDFLKISDKFKEQSFNLIKEINQMLDMVNPYTFRDTINRLIEPENKVIEIVTDDINTSENQIGTAINLEKNSKLSVNSNQIAVTLDAKSEASHSAVEESLNDHSFTETNSFNNFENTILKPIKLIDALLNQLTIESEMPKEIDEYSRMMVVNAELSAQNGFDILSQMHLIISDGLMHLKNKTLVPSKEVIESLRACLIVIVAVVKSKEVDITNYLNRAEVFGKFIQNIKAEEVK
jgi:hypothetical protein